MPSAPAPPPPGRLREVALLFLRLGATAFGGPAAHLAMMEREVVQRRGWLTHQEFLDLLGATNLIPGPNSTEMAIHLGRARAGWPGLFVAGACFISPAVLIVLAMAWAYVRFGSLPRVGGVLYGIKPVVIGVVLQALWSLGRTAIKTPLAGALALAVFALYLRGQSELALLFGGALAFAAVRAAQRGRRPPGAHGLAAPLLLGIAAPAGAIAAPVSLGRLFVVFAKIGATLYGSGYVLLAFLRNEVVEGRHWITPRQLLDAVSVGQFTPGPVFTTATFVGYLVAGPRGALVATLGIFLPSFVFVAATHGWVARVRAAPATSIVLDGLNVAAVGLMAGAAWELGRTTLFPDGRIEPWSVGILVVATLALLRWRVNSTWLILAGGLVGMLLGRLR